jgi:Predicted transcriptional regulators
MEYRINELSKLAGISARTLRYYDEIGILSPKRAKNNDYRVYGQNEVDLLQQILFFRELGVSLDEIKKIVCSQEYDGIAVLQEHLVALKAKRERMERLIANVEKTIATSKGGYVMNNKEKFDGFKQNLIAENEEKYGKEIREKFGDTIMDSSNAKMMKATKEQYEEIQQLSEDINNLLKIAFEDGDPSSENAQKVCALHKEWLGKFWNHYSKEAHLGVAQMYVDDSRFKMHYDNIAPGCAKFLYSALQIYCK